MTKKTKYELYGELLVRKTLDESEIEKQAEEIAKKAEAASSVDDYFGVFGDIFGLAISTAISKVEELSGVETELEKLTKIEDELSKIEAEISDGSISKDSNNETKEEKRARAIETISKAVEFDKRFAQEDDEYSKEVTSSIKLKLGNIAPLLEENVSLRKYSQVLENGYATIMENYGVVSKGIEKASTNPTGANIEVLLGQLRHAGNYLTSYMNVRNTLNNLLPEDEEAVNDRVFGKIAEKELSDSLDLVDQMDLSQKSVKLLSKSYRTKRNK